MATKVFVGYPGSLSNEKLDSLKKKVADALHILPDDVVVIPDGVTVSVAEVPHDLTARRDKADKEAEAAKAKQEAEAEKAQKAADDAAAKAEREAKAKAKVETSAK